MRNVKPDKITALTEESYCWSDFVYYMSAPYKCNRQSYLDRMKYPDGTLDTEKLYIMACTLTGSGAFYG